MTLPYELIGRVTVVLLVIAITAFVAWVFMLILGALLSRLMSELINLCWRGYDIHGEHPPRWRRELSMFLHCLRRRDFSDLQEKRENLKKREGRDA